MGYIKQFESQLFPNSAGNGLAATSLGSATDLVGRGIIGLDVRGVPLTPGMGSPQDMVNNPYLLDLSHKRRAALEATGAVDNPFTVAELERCSAPMTPIRVRCRRAWRRCSIRRARALRAFGLW